MKLANGKILGVVIATSKAGNIYKRLHCALEFTEEEKAKGFQGFKACEFGIFPSDLLFNKISYDLLNQDAEFYTMWNGKAEALCDFILKSDKDLK